MSGRYIIALDQGTTSSRTILIDRQGTCVDYVQHDFPQIYPKPGWVEHNPSDIIATQLGSFTELMTQHNLLPQDIEAIGITNQRETTIVWDKETGEPIANAIVWQCRRTADMVDRLCSSEQIKQTIRQKTGLIPDAYFSASKIAWLLDNVEGARERAEAGQLAFGTVDSYLIWVLTQGMVHATDVTNASRTMLYDIHAGQWDDELLALFNIPKAMMPQVRPSSGDFGITSNPNVPVGIPIKGVAGDQQAALFGQCCFAAGQAKNTYGTGCFLLMHTGFEAKESKHGLVTTIAASAPGVKHAEYVLEGSVFVAGALIQWLRDELKIIDSAQETEELALSVQDNAGVYIVPAFTGLGAPYWDADARGAIYGLTRGTSRAHIVRAALEALAYQLGDLVQAMQADAQESLSVLNVDGGASANNFLLQFQSDILQTAIRRPRNIESTALGAAFLAGLSSGFWSDVEELKSLRANDDIFEPHMTDEQAQELLTSWKQAVNKTLSDSE